MKTLILATLLAASFAGNAQKLKLTDGDLTVLKGETSIAFEFTYNDMGVGKFDKEKDYVDKKVEEMNAKEAGKGDTWAKAWVADRASRYEPKFIELFTKESDITESKTAKYTLIYHTTFTEPGFNIGVMKKNARTNATLTIVETANKSKKIAEIDVKDALGRTFWGSDFDTGVRIAETYADAGKAIGQFIKKKVSK